jgi:hypothetical protein
MREIGCDGMHTAVGLGMVLGGKVAAELLQTQEWVRDARGGADLGDWEDAWGDVGWKCRF